MRGRVLELESERLLRIGREEGMEQGRKEGLVQIVKRMLHSGKYTIEEIISISGLSENEIKDLKIQLSTRN